MHRGKRLCCMILVCVMLSIAVLGKTTDTMAAVKWKISCTYMSMYDFDKFNIKLSGTVGTVSVKTSNKKIAKVKKVSKTKYTISGVKEGTATITVSNKVGGKVYRKTCKVSIIASKLDPSVTRFVAHRGLSAQAPENTKKAFALAAKEKFYGIEADVRVTKDGKFVCMHDKSLSRMCGKNKKVSDLTYKQLRGYKITSGTNIQKYAKDKDATTVASLAEFLAICKKNGKVPYVEIKPGLSNKQLKALYNEISTAMGTKRAIIFEVDSSAKKKAGFEDLIYIKKLIKADGKKHNVGLIHMNTSGDDNIDILRKYGFETGFCHKNIPYSNINDYEVVNIPITIYTLNDELKAKKLVCAYGIHSMFSNKTLWK